ncbi:hypothetical protein AAMO2058_000354300 [Amorphochlora amoebiformis]
MSVQALRTMYARSWRETVTGARGFAKFKNKTHSGLKKRIKITGTGKMKHKRCFNHHNAEHFSGAKTMAMGKDKLIHKSFRKLIRKGLPNGLY